MDTIMSSKNLKTAGLCTLAAYLAQSFTAGQSKLVQGGAMFAAVAIALPFAAKL